MKTETSTLASLSWSRSESAGMPGVSSGSLSEKTDAERSLPNYETYPCPFWKRGLDYAAIIVSLPIVLPVTAAISLWVMLSSRGGVIFRQERVGFRGEHFTIYKFRSMRKAAATAVHTSHMQSLIENDGPLIKLDELGDDRLIPGGALLRMTGLDELPQLWNVLKGDMSLVGPRPCLPEEYALYKPEDKERFAVHPGLTGYWQILGKNWTTFSQMIEMDRTYVRKRSLLLDLFIMVQTPCALARQIAVSDNPMVDLSSSEKQDEVNK